MRRLLKKQRTHDCITILAAATLLVALWYWMPFRSTSTLAKYSLYQSTYDKRCQWTYNETGGGYAPVANEGRRHLAEYVCAATFRDMSDYVYSWPYKRFSEYDVWVADVELAAKNLPPVSDAFLRGQF